jgi:hypothetical protein
MTPGLRKLVLTVHLASSVGWIGAVAAYLALGILAVTSRDVLSIRAAWIGMEVIGWSVLVPLSFAALLTGLVVSLGTSWGLFRHYWVAITLALTVIATAVLLMHLPTVSALAAFARASDGPHPGTLGGDLFHAGGGLLILLSILVLNVYKPRGLTPYGWRKQQEQPHIQT